jgi:hypothetical protein
MASPIGKILAEFLEFVVLLSLKLKNIVIYINWIVFHILVLI